MQDPLSERYQRLLHGVYDCVDRIVLNAYFRRGHNGGGFRQWWRQLLGVGRGTGQHPSDAHCPCYNKPSRLSGRLKSDFRQHR